MQQHHGSGANSPKFPPRLHEERERREVADDIGGSTDAALVVVQIQQRRQ